MIDYTEILLKKKAFYDKCAERVTMLKEQIREAEFIAQEAYNNWVETESSAASAIGQKCGRNR